MRFISCNVVGGGSHIMAVVAGDGDERRYLLISVEGEVALDTEDRDEAQDFAKGLAPSRSLEDAQFAGDLVSRARAAKSTLLEQAQAQRAEFLAE